MCCAFLASHFSCHILQSFSFDLRKSLLVCASVVNIKLQGRGGEELSAELSSAIQRCLLGGKSGAGTF